MAICTWNSKSKGKCKTIATEDCTGMTGEVWAKLCQHHNQRLAQACATADPKIIMAAWVAAKGGAAKAAADMNKSADVDIKSFLAKHENKNA